MTDPKLEFAVRDAVARSVAVVGLAALAVIHLIDGVPGKFDETPYIGWMYMGLIVAALAVAALLIRSSDRRAWMAAGVLSAVTLTGYVLSRSTGLPQATGDIGNWTEPLGLASLFVEGSLVALCGAMLLSRRTAEAPEPVTSHGRQPNRAPMPDRARA
jgi:hypothetical protein